jgi:hypothetical protein
LHTALELLTQGLNKVKFSAKMKKKTFSRLHIWKITYKKGKFDKQITDETASQAKLLQNITQISKVKE